MVPDARTNTALAIAAQPLVGGEDVRRVAEERDATMPVRGQMRDGLDGATDVVHQHGVRHDVARGPVQEHHGRARPHLRHQIAVLQPGGHDEQPVDPAGAELQRQLAFTAGILVRRPGDHLSAAQPGDFLDSTGHAGVERVADVLQHQSDRAGGRASAKVAGTQVPPEPELVDGRQHALGGGRVHARLVVDHARDGLDAHARQPCDVVHRRAADLALTGNGAAGGQRCHSGRISPRPYAVVNRSGTGQAALHFLVWCPEQDKWLYWS